MDLQAEIKWIQSELNEVKDPTFIKAIKNMIKYRRKVTASSTERISVEQYNLELDQSEKEIESGHYYTQDQVEKIAGKWGRK